MSRGNVRHQQKKRYLTILQFDRKTRLNQRIFHPQNQTVGRESFELKIQGKRLIDLEVRICIRHRFDETENRRSLGHLTLQSIGSSIEGDTFRCIEITYGGMID